MYIGECTPAQNYKPPFSSAERSIAENDAPQIFDILRGPSPWQQYIRSNLSAQIQSILNQRPIRIVNGVQFVQAYQPIFNKPPTTDTQGFVDRRNARIYLKEFNNANHSLAGIALHEAVHLSSHPPGKSNMLRATSYDFLGTGLLEGLTQVITEDIQIAQCITPLRRTYQAYKEYVPVARRFMQIFTAAAVGNTYFNGNVPDLYRLVEQRWTVARFQGVKILTGEKRKTQALQLINSLEEAYFRRPKLKGPFQSVFR